MFVNGNTRCHSDIPIFRTVRKDAALPMRRRGEGRFPLQLHQAFGTGPEGITHPASAASSQEGKQHVPGTYWGPEQDAPIYRTLAVQVWAGERLCCLFQPLCLATPCYRHRHSLAGRSETQKYPDPRMTTAVTMAAWLIFIGYHLNRPLEESRGRK